MAPIIVNDGLLISAQQFFREGMDDGVCVCVCVCVAQQGECV